MIEDHYIVESPVYGIVSWGHCYGTVT